MPFFYFEREDLCSGGLWWEREMLPEGEKVCNFSESENKCGER